MDFVEDEAAFILKAYVIQKAIQEEKDATRLHPNPLINLAMMKGKCDYGAIQYVSVDPVIVYYCLPQQMHINNTYIYIYIKEASRNSSVSTGFCTLRGSLKK